MPNEAITRLYSSPKRWVLIAPCVEQTNASTLQIGFDGSPPLHGIGSPDYADRRSLQARRLE